MHNYFIYTLHYVKYIITIQSINFWLTLLKQQRKSFYMQKGERVRDPHE